MSMFGRLKPEAAKSRSIDGMKGKRQENIQAAVLDAKVLPWKDEKTAQGDNSDQIERRQKQIINYFTAARRVVVSPEEIVGLDSRRLRELKREREKKLRMEALNAEDVKVDDEQRREFLKKLADNEISSEDVTEFLLAVRSPLDVEDGAMKMFDRIMVDPRATQILAVAAGYNLVNWQKVDKSAMKRILSTVQPDGDDYRTPVGFKKFQMHFLDGIRPKATAQVYRYYEQSMQELMRILYGERMEYFEALEKLRNEAEQAGNVTESAPTEKYERISDEQGAEMLGRAVIDGDTWSGNGTKQHLSTHNLAEAKLAPIYEVRLDDGRIALSRIFQVPGVGVGAIAYVYCAQGIKVRSFYRVQGQVLWRYLPDYTRRMDGGLGQLLAGYGENSVFLPIGLQETLAKIEQRDGAKVLARGGITLNPEFFLLGTTYGYNSLQEFQAAWGYGRVQGDYYREVASEAINQDFGEINAAHKKAPYTLAIDFGRAPDFGQQMARFAVSGTELGTVELRGYRSHDEQLCWLIGNDRRGRAWVEQVEAVSPLTSLGLRRDWTEMGDFVTALYEPTTRAGIYGDRGDTKGAKQCMWKNYLSNVPLIQSYVKFRKTGRV